jgi:hypothetical protein
MAVAEPLDHSNDKPGAYAPSGVGHLFTVNRDFHPEPEFDRLLYLERKRTERSRRPFLLLLLNVETLIPGSGKEGFIHNLETALSSSVRETDIKGWYEQGKVAGIILTELNSIDEVVQDKILLKIQDRLVQALGSEAVNKIRVSYHAFPNLQRNGGDGMAQYPLSEVTKQPAAKKSPFVKRFWTSPEAFGACDPLLVFLHRPGDAYSGDRCLQTGAGWTVGKPSPFSSSAPCTSTATHRPTKRT